MHTLLSHNHLDPGQFANDSLAFMRGFRGHSNALMREFASNSERGLKGPDAAGTSDHANSLMKVGTLHTFCHHTSWDKLLLCVTNETRSTIKTTIMLYTVTWAVYASTAGAPDGGSLCWP